MTPDILRWLTQHVPMLDKGDVLEVGSYDVNGTPRPLFSQCGTYTGTDMRDGPGVDLVANNYDLLATFGPDMFDAVLCLECLEHDRMFWDTVEQMRAMVRIGGYLVITTPANGFPYHAYPKDYWRFTMDAYHDLFFDGMDVIEVRTIASPVGPDTTVVGIARKM